MGVVLLEFQGDPQFFKCRNYTCLHTWNVRFILEANQLGTSNIALKFISEARCGSASESTREAQADFSGISNRLAAVTFPD
ncbi:hypothetical protein ANTPLA_LOCUS4341 [Anthophora plagiata]